MLLFSLLIACNQSKNTSKVVDEESKLKKYSDPKDEFMQFDNLKEEKFKYKDSILSWEGYKRVHQSLDKLRNNTPNEVLNLSEELVENTKWMRDTISVEAMKNKGMRARMNTFYNQALRLQEMKSISSITVAEIEKQTAGLFVVFRMVNRKIDAIYEQQNFEKDLLEDDFVFSRLDSIN